MKCKCGEEMEVIYWDDDNEPGFWWCKACGRLYYEMSLEWFEHEGLKK
jgi:hypothetical protein